MLDYNTNDNSPKDAAVATQHSTEAVAATQSTTNAPAAQPRNQGASLPKKPKLKLAPLARALVITPAPSSGLCPMPCAYGSGAQHFSSYQEHVPVIAETASSGVTFNEDSALVPKELAARTRVKPKHYDVTNIRPPKGGIGVLTELFDSFEGYPVQRLPDTVVNHLDRQVIQINLRVDTTRFTVPKAERQCPYCGAMGTLDSAGVESITLRDTPYQGHPVKIEILRTAWRCSACEGKHTERCPGQFRDAYITQQKYVCISDKLHSGCKSSLRDIAIGVIESEKFIAKILDYEAEQGDKRFVAAYRLAIGYLDQGKKPACNFKPPKRPIRQIAIDEVSIVRKEFITLFSDLENGELLYYAWGRGKDGVAKFMAWAGDIVVEDVQVATDMNAGFLSAMEEFRPKCGQTYDRFHFERNAMEHLTNMLKEIAWDLQRGGLKEEAKLLRDKSNQSLLFTADDELWGAKEREHLASLLNLHPMVKVVRDCFSFQHNGFECYTTKDKEAARALFESAMLSCNTLQHWAVASNKLKFKLVPELDEYFNPPKSQDQNQHRDRTTAHAQTILTDAEKSRLKVCDAGTLGRNILNHMDRFLNYVEFGLTTGPLEGFNNLFKAMKRVCFGIKRLDRFMYRLKILSLAPYHRWV